MSSLANCVASLDPTSGMQKPLKMEESRERVLTADEIKLLWRQFSELDYPFGIVLKLLLLTGQRRDEVGYMRWQDLNFEKGLWSLTREFTKNKLPHVVPLQGMTLDIIKAQPKIAMLDEGKDKSVQTETKANYVFTTTGKTPISGWSKIKVRIEERLKENNKIIPDWRFHDLRRTVSSGLGDLGYHDSDI